jgi:hypothetical protein
MPTLILPPRHTEDTQLMWRAAVAQGWDIERLTAWRVAPDLNIERPVLYGEPLFAVAVADQLRITWLSPPADWLTAAGRMLTRRRVARCTVAEARAESAPFFAKTAGDEKAFLPRVFASGADLPDISSDIPLLIAEPVEWLCEFRCFIARRRLVTMSPYLRGGELARTAVGAWRAPDAEVLAARAFIRDILASDVELPDAVVVDIGEIRDRGWAVVELNAPWGSGIYGCDPVGVLSVLELATLRNGSNGG